MKNCQKKASEPNQSILGSFLMFSQATDMLEQKSQQFWNLLIKAVLMIPINPDNYDFYFLTLEGGHEIFKFFSYHLGWVHRNNFDIFGIL